ncbi:transporter [Burkholderia sp. Ax-1719]|uniref:SphA family protein n=1 Tax=Burkholderia sp. Ax-1719 TaxID=2608334 RepID=UPI0014246D87|nr:transporter [Burkholderia sp. Ax-1719]NIE62635.1 phenol degradation protein meta [Burkholderia sp. Ax-1719]
MNSNYLRLLGAGLIASAITFPVHATENGQVSYPFGVNTVLNGMLPPPGSTQYFNYSLYYSSSKFAGSDGGSAVPGFHLSVVAQTPRVVHTWAETLGPFTLSSSTIVPLLYTRLSTPGGTGNRASPGDMILEPLMLGYANQSKTLFAFFSPSFAVPSGAYSVNRIANTGLNTYAFLPYASVTWFPHPDWEISTTTLLEMNSPNHATHYHSGAVAMFDYLLGYSVSQRWQLGVQGTFLKQFTDDTQNGVRVGADGFRAQTVALGPQLRYMWGPASGVVVKYQREFAVRNRPQGDKLWVQFSFPL